MRTSLSLSLVFALFGSVLLAPVRAQARDIPCQAVDPGVIAVDGLLGDWNGVQPTTVGAGDLTMDVRCNFTQSDLYLAVQVHEGAEAAGDALDLYFAPAERGPLTTLSIAPAGRRVHWHGAAPPRDRSHAPAVVARAPDGYVVEMSIARDELPGDAPDVPAIPFAAVATSGGDTLSTSNAVPPRGPLDRIELASGAATLDSFLAQVGASRDDISWDHLARVTEDPGAERVVIAKNHVGVISASTYYYYDLPVSDPADIAGADLVDLSGDGRAWVIVRYRQRAGAIAEDVLAALRTVGDRIEVPFAHVVEVRAGGDVLMDDWRYEMAPRSEGGGMDIVFSAEPAKGWTRASAPAQSAQDDVYPLVPPWNDQDKPAKPERWHFEGDAAAEQ